MSTTLQRSLIAKDLYQIFRLNYKHEEYIVTVKLLFIYDCLASGDHNDTIQSIVRLKHEYQKRSRRLTIDAIHRELEHQMFERNGRYAPAGARAPIRYGYQPGWSIA